MRAPIIGMLGQKRRGTGRFKAPLCPEQPFYAVGDIHGRADLLDRLLALIDKDFAARKIPPPTIVFVGDYVDRGPESAETLAQLIDLSRALPDNVVCLRGNHEQMMLDFLDDPVGKGGRWLRNGGLQTLESFGVGGLADHSRGDALAIARDQLRARLPHGTEAWLRDLPLTWSTGNVVCVHAALDPAAAPTDPDPKVALWGHRAFLGSVRTDGIWVVHGHTVVKDPSAEGGRIAVDTGAFFSGRLTAAFVETDCCDFVSTLALR